MATERTQRMIANICMSQIRNYYNDLKEFYTGQDAGRFNRMVVDGGKQLPSASPSGWANHINLLAIECADYHADELRLIFDQLKAWGLTVDDSLLQEAQPHDNR